MTELCTEEVTVVGVRRFSVCSNLLWIARTLRFLPPDRRCVRWPLVCGVWVLYSPLKSSHVKSCQVSAATIDDETKRETLSLSHSLT